MGEPRLTLKARKQFIARLAANGGHIGDACTHIGVSRVAAWKRRQRDKKFREQWDEAAKISIGVHEDELIRRGLHGVKKMILYHGKPVQVTNAAGELETLYETVYSDTDLLAHLRARDPELFRPPTEVSGPKGGPIQMEDSTPVVIIVPDNNRRRDKGGTGAPRLSRIRPADSGSGEQAASKGPGATAGPADPAG